MKSQTAVQTLKTGAMPPFGTATTRAFNARNLIRTLIALAWLSVFVSCETAQTQDRAIVLDKSFSTALDNMPNAQEMYEQLLEELDIDSAGFSSHGCNVYVAVIGENGVPRMKVINLKAQSHWLLVDQDKRVKEIANFKKDLLATLTTYFEEDPGESYTHIYKPLAYILNRFQTQSFNRIYCFSDLIEASPLLDMNASICEESPPILGEAFEPTSKKLLSDTPLPQDLENTEIVFIYDVEGGKDVCSSNAGKYWKRLFQRTGASITFQANL